MENMWAADPQANSATVEPAMCDTSDRSSRHGPCTLGSKTKQSTSLWAPTQVVGTAIVQTEEAAYRADSRDGEGRLYRDPQSLIPSLSASLSSSSSSSEPFETETDADAESHDSVSLRSAPECPAESPAAGQSASREDLLRGLGASHVPDLRIFEEMDRYVECEDGVACYLLDSKVPEKEASVDRQATSTREYPHRASSATHASAHLSAQSTELGHSVFVPFALGMQTPERPSQSGRKGFLVVSPSMIAFRGVGGRDMAKIWHMLLVPRAELAMRTITRPSAAGPCATVLELRWLYDLRPEHAALLRRLREDALIFLRANRAYFVARVGEESAVRWLDPSAVRFGFHSRPSVGYLHMHMLVGPLTVFGTDEVNFTRWVSLSSILEVLDAGLPASTLLPAARSRD